MIRNKTGNMYFPPLPSIFFLFFYFLRCYADTDLAGPLASQTSSFLLWLCPLHLQESQSHPEVLSFHGKGTLEKKEGGKKISPFLN